MKLSKEERTEIESCTLESLQTDYQRFMENGGLKKDAKNQYCHNRANLEGISRSGKIISLIKLNFT